jgi:selenide,water dikinase
MRRSRQLGHCICDPRKPCPCDLLIEKDVCLCAGERLEEPAAREESVRLTKLVKNAGCASKIPAAELSRILKRLPEVSDPRLLVGMGTADDAGVFRVSDDLCLVQTVDVFAPCVDDPYLFGQIAACNSLSDCYAMGGTPITALSIIGYPISTQPSEWMYRMLLGGMDKLREAGVVLVGGHSINDEEMKFGFAITGSVRPDAVVTNAGAQPGDLLVLTKPIGTGIISFAAQVGRASEESLRAIEKSMSTLNRTAAEIMVRFEAHACTDVTGFGLLGHLRHMVRESGVTAEIWAAEVPVFPDVRRLAAEGVAGGAVERNREFAEECVQADDGLSEGEMDVLYDAQTSGGLLIALSAKVAEECLAALRESGCEDAAIVGRIAEKSEGRIHVTNQASSQEPRKDGAAGSPSVSPKPGAALQSSAVPPEEECCAPGAAVAAGNAPEAFKQFMGNVFAPGALDVIQKELMTIALSVAVQCEPCLKIHLAKAREMGISAEEIEEAAWMGVAFGGCKAMMFWQANNAGTPKS